MEGLVESCNLGGVDVRGVDTNELDMVRTAIEELADGALATDAELRDGPEERFPGAVTIFAISRPSSPILPCTSVSSSRSSTMAASTDAGSPV